MKTFVRMGDRLGKVSTASGSNPGRHVCKGRFARVQCGVLAFMLAFFMLVGPSKATPPNDEVGFLSEETTKAIERELGINLGYMFAINKRGSFVIGVTPGVEIESFENQLELWRMKRKIFVKEVQSLEIVRFRRNPLEHCFPYPAFGSLVWYCVTFPDLP